MSDDGLEPHPGLQRGWWHDNGCERSGRVFRPIGVGDLEHLRRWRNTQQDVLRQQHPLTREHQQRWYADVVAPSYATPRPPALLVVAELDSVPVSYGGLTNIEWISRRGELSFLTAPERASDPAQYDADFSAFLEWVLDVAFDELAFHRVFTETWSFRTAHIKILERAGLQCEGRMREHVTKEGVRYDALLHGILRTDARDR